jgi:anthranilate synthase component 1
MSHSPTPSASAAPTVRWSSVSSDRAAAPQIRELTTAVDLLALHALAPARYPFLLESAAGAGPTARYDLLLAFPRERLTATTDGEVRFVDRLDASWTEARKECSTGGRLPFNGGWFLYLGYELAGELEPTLKLPPASDALPPALAVRIPCAVVRDRLQGRCYLVAEQGAEGLLDEMQHDLQCLASAGSASAPPDLAGLVLSEAEPRRYLDGVRRIRDYIREGDVFQVNLARAWATELPAAVSNAALYRRLRNANPAPFAALCELGEGAIISSSPERLVSVRAGVISTRPIAGTRPRGRDTEADAALSAELLAHPKERAEHVMLVDLERNDLGRVCRPGSVEVDEFMVLESYAHVHHIVSNVVGRLQEDVTPGQVIRALFPGGTITGCPKVRCMEIIAELEGEGRGAYTGSVGYLDHSGDLDLNILIRTLVRRGDRLSWRTGAGIVADSDPERELEETRHKAEGLLRALGA